MDAKQRASGMCSRAEGGCEYRLSGVDDGWTVHVDPILVSNGRRSYAVDADDMYFYDTQGRFTGALRGY